METRQWRARLLALDASAKMGIRRMPYAFTEQGVAMLSSVLNSERAVKVNIAIMRAFVRLRQMLARHKELARRLEALEQRLDRHGTALDEEIRAIWVAIERLTEPGEKPKKSIGFQPPSEAAPPDAARP